ncbi:hypothetical protein SAMN02745121_06577 [Nannocystis exedens]|uniref:Uncharacterized protein n=2 Tax=Nannocystis exedens TaxID=54 RepID=A0A1I2FCI5_9BACT|nr:hypothetical protein NAEX_03567 [Nannocystis exedens]SFF03184.1 hypothetical protein SAMN02745121_06577 [Nannocystis exedens]
MQPRRTAEEVLFEHGAVKITPARVVSGGTTDAVANITSVKAATDTTCRVYGAFIVLLGLLLALTRSTEAIVLGVLHAVFGKYTEVVLTTGAAEQKAFRARDEKLALEVASAIDLAIMKRGALLGR